MDPVDEFTRALELAQGEIWPIRENVSHITMDSVGNPWLKEAVAGEGGQEVAEWGGIQDVSIKDRDQ